MREHENPDELIPPPGVKDSLEIRLDSITRELRETREERKESNRRLHAIDTKIDTLAGVVARIDSVAMVTAARQHHLTREVDIQDADVAKVRAEMRQMHSRIRQMTLPVAPQPQPELADMTETQRRRAMTETDARLMLADQRIKELEAERTADKENTTWMRRYAIQAGVGAVIALCITVMASYITYRLTRPTFSQTVETKK